MGSKMKSVVTHTRMTTTTHTHTTYMIMSAGTEPVAHTNNLLTACVNVSAVLKMMDTGYIQAGQNICN